MVVDRGDLTVKLWLDPNVLVADNHGYSRRELREIERITREHLEQLRVAQPTTRAATALERR